MYYDLLVHVDDNDKARLNLAMNNCANYAAALPGETFKTVMVVTGPAAQLFTKENADQAERGEALMKKGLSIRLCNNALNAFKVDRSKLWKGCEIIPAGMVEIVRLQREGYAYVKP